MQLGPEPPVVKKTRGSNDPFLVSKTRSWSRLLFSFSFLAYSAERLTVTFDAAYGWDTLTSKKVRSSTHSLPFYRIEYVQCHYFGMSGMHQLYLREMASRNSCLLRINPSCFRGKAVNHDEAPFSCVASRHRLVKGSDFSMTSLS